MAFSFQNQTNAPVNIAVSNGGFIYFYKNALPIGQTWSCAPELVWYDVLVSYRILKSDDIDPAAHNWLQAVAIGTTTLGAAVAVGGVVMIPFSAGTSATATAWGIGLAVSGGVVATVGVAGTIANAVLNPATAEGFYGGDDYTFSVTGAIDGIVDPANNHLEILGAETLGFQWKNETSGTSNIVRAEESAATAGVTNATIRTAASGWMPSILHTMMRSS